jgi:hypothetical protein
MGNPSKGVSYLIWLSPVKLNLRVWEVCVEKTLACWSINIKFQTASLWMLPPVWSHITRCCRRRGNSSCNWIALSYRCYCCCLIIMNWIYWNVVSTSYRKSSISCIPILHKVTSSIYYISTCLCGLLPKFEISMLPKAPKDNCKSLTKFLRDLM